MSAATDYMHAEDKALVKRLLAGHEPSFRQFFDDNYDRLYRFALTRLRNRQGAAEEVAQSTLSKALNRIETYRGESQLYTWLCAICRREVAGWYRANRKREENIVLIEDHSEIRGAVETLAASDNELPETAVQRREIVRLIQVAMDQLPPRYGNALEWKYVEGHSTAEIAAKLGIGTEAAQSLLARARRAFADVYPPLVKPIVRSP